MKKKIIIPFAILAAILILAGCVIGYMATHSMSFSTGRCIVTSNGSYLILLDGSPVNMSNRSGSDDLFADLQTGDEILILHDGIQETYPGGTGVYFCRKQSSGTITDIPTDIIESLSPMGWIPVDETGRTHEIYTGTVISFEPVYQDEGNFLLKLRDDAAFLEEITLTMVQKTELQMIGGLSEGDRVCVECYTEDSGYKEVTKLTEYQSVSYEYSFANMSLELPAGWTYEIREYSEGELSFGIDFWPENESEGKLRLDYYPELFGVCGTGLKEEQIWVGHIYRAFQGTYDNRPVWDFISIRDLPGSYVITTENVDGWWDIYGQQAMDILDSMVLAEGMIRANRAIEVAEQALKGDFTHDSVAFDFCTGEWVVAFTDQETYYTVYVTADGTVRTIDTYDPNAALAAKPVIYLYPEVETTVSVQLDFAGTLTTTYPKYQNGWTVLAKPDGTLTDPATGREYYCVFWEGMTNTQYDLSQGFVIPGSETRAFLEFALSEMGLTDREANEFLIYWLPQMEGNPYNLISFQQETYTQSAELTITPAPDSILRVFMAWKPLAEPIEVQPQSFNPFERVGFTVVEWGGARINEP